MLVLLFLVAPLVFAGRPFIDHHYPTPKFYYDILLFRNSLVGYLQTHTIQTSTDEQDLSLEIFETFMALQSSEFSHFGDSNFLSVPANQHYEIGYGRQSQTRFFSEMIHKELEKFQVLPSYEEQVDMNHPLDITVTPCNGSIHREVAKATMHIWHRSRGTGTGHIAEIDFTFDCIM
jgi:hypothetical protein